MCIRDRNIRASILPGESTKIVSKGNGGNQICSYISLEKLKQIIACSRKPNAKVIAKDLGMEIINTHCVAIESTNIAFIMAAFSGESMIHQYYVDPYFIDLYFDKYKIAVECDEQKNTYTKSICC